MDIGRFLCELASIPPSEATKDLEQLIAITDGLTAKVVIAMFTENTGSNPLDSGGAYGYGYDHAKKIKDWDLIPEVSWKGYYSKSTYHYIVEHLDYNPIIDKQFHDFCQEDERKNKNWRICTEEFFEHLELSGYIRNTYNNDTCLDEVLQYGYSMEPNDDGEYIIIIQTHNGCDVRGGYSVPHVFTTDDRDAFICDETDGIMYCSECSNYVTTDDAYHWYGGDYGTTNKAEDLSPDENSYNESIRCIRCGELYGIEGNKDIPITSEQIAHHIKRYWSNHENPIEEIKKERIIEPEYFYIIEDYNKEIKKQQNIRQRKHKRERMRWKLKNLPSNTRYRIKKLFKRKVNEKMWEKLKSHVSDELSKMNKRESKEENLDDLFYYSRIFYKEFKRTIERIEKG